LTVRTDDHADGTVGLEVEDTGPGIDSLATNKIFDAFNTTKAHGMGLGLAICQTIVERHNGRISVVAARPRGCIFRVVIPAAGASAS
jgi:signal transduction histidine kinase